MTYEEGIDYIYSLPKRRLKEYGTDGVLKFLKILNNLQDEVRCIHVAGTNGKGSMLTLLVYSLFF